MPGGAGDYMSKARFIYDKAIEINLQGESSCFPLFGICKGFEYMAIFASTSGDPLTDLKSIKQMLSLEYLTT